VSIQCIGFNVFVMDFTSMTINTNALRFWEVYTTHVICCVCQVFLLDLFELCIHQVFILFLKIEPV
jgi:hypothetical protein